MSPIVVIGAHPGEMGDLVYLAVHKYAPEFLEMLESGGYEIYDMVHYPEKGDGIDAITPETPLVVAVHLYGIHRHDREVHLGHDYFYTRENHRLLGLTAELGVPLLVLGDQPRGYAQVERYD